MLGIYNTLPDIREREGGMLGIYNTLPDIREREGGMLGINNTQSMVAILDNFLTDGPLAYGIT